MVIVTELWIFSARKECGFGCSLLVISMLVQVLTKVNFWRIFFMYDTFVLSYQISNEYYCTCNCWLSWLGYELGNLRFRLPLPAGSGDFSFLQSKQTSFGAHPAFYLMGTNGFLPKDKMVLTWSKPHSCAYCRGYEYVELLYICYADKCTQYMLFNTIFIKCCPTCF